MAAKAIDKSAAEAILIDWRVGQLSQQQIAEKHKVSKGLANKLCKGVEQDGVAIVTAGVEYQQALSQHDDRIVNAVQKAVDEIVRVQKFFQGAQMAVAKTVVIKVQRDGVGASYQDLNCAANVLSRAQIAVLGGSPGTVVTNKTFERNESSWICTPEQLRAINQMLEASV